MISYLIRRILIAVVTLILITFVIYGLIRSIPGDPITVDMAQSDPSRSLSPEDRKRLEKIYGLDKHWTIAYGQWIGNLVRLEMGQSISRKLPVARLIRDRLLPTLLLSVSSLLITYILCIPLGLWITVRDGTVGERALSTGLYMLYSLPSFVAALFLQLLLSVKLGWLPLMGMVSDDYEQMSLLGKTWDIFKHALMPAACFTYGSLAYYTRFVKSNMMEVVRQDYVRTAKAKGVTPVGVVWKHAFRNTLIPLVTLIGLTLPALLSGAVILEQIYSWPGMGSLFFASIRERDYPTIMGLTLVFSALTLLGQLLADLLYAVVDPRVTYS